MNLEKLQEETTRLRLEVERRQLNWEGFLRRFFVAVLYQTLVLLILLFFFSASLKIIATLALAFLLWEIGSGAALWLELKAARKSLQSWNKVVNQTSEPGA